jgi:hypothetical protein
LGQSGITPYKTSVSSFTHNTATGNTGPGIVLWQKTEVSNFSDNNIFGNSVSSLPIYGVMAPNCGIWNGSYNTVQATHSYWGAATGPGTDPADAVGGYDCDKGGSVTLFAPFATEQFPAANTLTFTESQAGGTLVTSAGTWNFGAASNVNGNAVLLNGGGTDGWATLLEVANDGQLYAQAGDGSWWRWNNPGWSASTAPLEGQVSPDGSTLIVTQAHAGGTLVTVAGTWNFGAVYPVSPVYGGNAVLLNGRGTGGWATLLEVANGGQLYAQAVDGSWWRWNNPGWSSSAGP